MTIPENVQNADYAQQLGSYLEQLRVTLRQHAISRKRSGWIWTGLFLGLGLLATVLSGLAGFSSASERFTDYVAILALVGAGLTGFVTLVNPAQRAQVHLSTADSCESLATEVDQLIRLDLPRDFKGRRLDDVRALVERVSVQFDSLRQVPERPRLWRHARHQPSPTTARRRRTQDPPGGSSVGPSGFGGKHEHGGVGGTVVPPAAGRVGVVPGVVGPLVVGQSVGPPDVGAFDVGPSVGLSVGLWVGSSVGPSDVASSEGVLVGPSSEGSTVGSLSMPASGCSCRYFSGH